MAQGPKAQKTKKPAIASHGERVVPWLTLRVWGASCGRLLNL